jgi:quinol monooxygenase YgiN
MHMIVKIVSLQFKPEFAETGTKLLMGSLEDTRRFPGCVSVEVLEDSADPTKLHLVERWSTPEDSVLTVSSARARVPCRSSGTC